MRKGILSNKIARGSEIALRVRSRLRHALDLAG